MLAKAVATEAGANFINISTLMLTLIQRPFKFLFHKSYSEEGRGIFYGPDEQVCNVYDLSHICYNIQAQKHRPN